MRDGGLESHEHETEYALEYFALAAWLQRSWRLLVAIRLWVVKFACGRWSTDTRRGDRDFVRRRCVPGCRADDPRHDRERQQR
jgi:hypothetical protein